MLSTMLSPQLGHIFRRIKHASQRVFGPHTERGVDSVQDQLEHGISRRADKRRQKLHNHPHSRKERDLPQANAIKMPKRNGENSIAVDWIQESVWRVRV